MTTPQRSCYAAGRGGCSSGLSREHYVSRSVLDLFSDGDAVSLGGFAWMAKGKVKDLPIDAITARVLCEEHNRQLSPLDSEALRLFQTWERMYPEFANPANPSSWTERVDGELLERWMLKTLCGCASSGVVAMPETVRPGWHIPDTWISVLFGDAPMPANCGLYLLSEPGDQATAERAIVIEPFGLGGELVGVRMELNGLSLALFMDPPALPLEKRQLITCRPARIVFCDAQSEKGVHLGWTDGGTLRARYSPS